jgi:hypothetical protein
MWRHRETEFPKPQIVKTFGGRGRDRTGDPLLAKQVLSQLSYTPTAGTTFDSKVFAVTRTLENGDDFRSRLWIGTTRRMSLICLVWTEHRR